MRYHNITMDDMKNGDGLRTVLWVSGCSHHCKDCHNPITWNPEIGLPFDEWAKAELMMNLAKPWIEGVTFSGGDPLFEDNRETVGNLISFIRTNYPDKNIWVYTGYCFEDLSDLPFLKDIDVLVDGRYECDKRDVTLKWRGSMNQRVIDVKMSLETGKVVLHCD